MEKGLRSTLEFGPRNLEKLPLPCINALTQTRKSTPQEGIDELKRAIVQLPTSAGYEMVHPPGVALLSPEETANYITELNLCHGTNHVIEELVPTENGDYAILIYGHRRLLSASQIASDEGVAPSDVVVDCSVNRSISFSDALEKQINENTARPLPLFEVAKAIQARYQYGLARGQYQTVSDCIRDLPFGEQKIREALYFCDLPEPMQTLVEEGRLTYGVAVALYPYQRELVGYYHEEPPDRKEKLITYQMMTETVKALNGRWSRDFVSARVKGLIEDLRSKVGHDQMALEMELEDELTIQKRRFKEAVRELREKGADNLDNYLHLLRNNPSLLALQSEEERRELIMRLLNFVEVVQSIGIVDKALSLELL